MGEMSRAPGGDDERQRRLASIRALGDSMRFEIFDILTVEGAMTTARLLEHFPESRGSLAYDLRDLVDAGHLSRHETESGETRWSANPGSLELEDHELRDPELRAAVEAVNRVVDRRRWERGRQWSLHREEWGSEWGDAALGADYLSRMTPHELKSLEAELRSVAKRHVRAALDRDRSGEQSAERSTVFITLTGFPCHLGE